MAEGSYGQVRWAVLPGGGAACRQEWEQLDERLQLRFEVLFHKIAEDGLIRNPDRFRELDGPGALCRLQVEDAVIIACRHERETVLLMVLHPTRGVTTDAEARARALCAEDIGGHI